MVDLTKKFSNTEADQEALNSFMNFLQGPKIGQATPVEIPLRRGEPEENAPVLNEALPQPTEQLPEVATPATTNPVANNVIQPINQDKLIRFLNSTKNRLNPDLTFYDKMQKDLESARNQNLEDLKNARLQDSNANMYSGISAGINQISQGLANRAGYTDIKTNPFKYDANKAEQVGTDNKAKLDALMERYKIASDKERTKMENDARKANIDLKVLEIEADTAKSNAALEAAAARNKALLSKEERAEKRLEMKEEDDKKRYLRNAFLDTQKVLLQDGSYKKMVEQADAFGQIGGMLKNIETTGNQASLATLGTKMAKAMGEVGVLTDSDVTRYVGGTSWWRKVQDWYTKGATGDLPKDTLNDLKQNVKLIENALNSKRTKMYENVTSRVQAANEDLPTETIHKFLGYTPSNEKAVSNENTGGMASPQYGQEVTNNGIKYRWNPNGINKKGTKGVYEPIKE